MNKLIIISILLFSYFSVRGQSEIKLTIDTNCYCDSSTESLKGKFGIYAYNVAVPRYSNSYVDTLIKELKVTEEQIITVERGDYILKYIPSASSERINQYYISSLQDHNQIHLNCFFFNKRYLPMINNLEKGGSITFTSSYYGNTNGDTQIPTHTIVIFSKRKKYYASYYKTVHKGIQLLPLEYDFKYQEPKFEPQVLLSDSQIQKINDFEAQLMKLSNNDNLNKETNVINRIFLKDKTLTFYSREYLSLLLWKELNKKY